MFVILTLSVAEGEEPLYFACLVALGIPDPGPFAIGGLVRKRKRLRST